MLSTEKSGRRRSAPPPRQISQLESGQKLTFMKIFMRYWL